MVPWPWMPSNPGFKVTVIFTAKYLKTVRVILSNCRYFNLRCNVCCSSATAESLCRLLLRAVERISDLLYSCSNILAFQNGEKFQFLRSFKTFLTQNYIGCATAWCRHCTRRSQAVARTADRIALQQTIYSVSQKKSPLGFSENFSQTVGNF